MFVRNAWYVAGWSSQFNAQELVACSILSEPIVLYRKRDNSLVALEDRCVHRFAPLSLGCREGDDLRCRYHGLKFAPSGKCIESPGERLIPASARVRSFPVIERHSWVWIWPGDPARADPALIPAAIGLDHPEWTLKAGQFDYAAGYRLVNDNLLDFSHVSYLHQSSFRANNQWACKRPAVTLLPRGVRVQRWVENMTSLRNGAAVDNWCFYDFLVPGVLLLLGRIYPVGTAASCQYEQPTTAPLSETFSCQAVTPLTETTSRYFFSWGPRSGEGAAATAEALLNIAREAFAEDKTMVEAQQKNILRSPNAQIMPTSSDRAAMAFQTLMDRLIRAEGWTEAVGTVM